MGGEKMPMVHMLEIQLRLAVYQSFSACLFLRGCITVSITRKTTSQYISNLNRLHPERKLLEQCGGTSLREVFMSLAEDRGWSGARVVGCKRQAEVQFYDPPVCWTWQNSLVYTRKSFFWSWLLSGAE